MNIVYALFDPDWRVDSIAHTKDFEWVQLVQDVVERSLTHKLYTTVGFTHSRLSRMTLEEAADQREIIRDTFAEYMPKDDSTGY